MASRPHNKHKPYLSVCPRVIFRRQVSLCTICDWLYHRGLVLRQLNWKTKMFNRFEPNLKELSIRPFGEAVTEEYAENSRRASLWAPRALCKAIDLHALSANLHDTL